LQPAERANLSKKWEPSSVQKLSERLCGKWQGEVKTWFEPGVLADTSTIAGEYSWALEGKILRHQYRSEINGRPRSGEELLAFNEISQKWELVWFDTFHMNYGLLNSTGDSTASGFSVTGNYAVGPGMPDWGWRTEYRLATDDQLIIQAFNQMPEGEEALAIEVTYRRVTASPATS
jgi:hypothetical protein